MLNSEQRASYRNGSRVLNTENQTERSAHLQRAHFILGLFSWGDAFGISSRTLLRQIKNEIYSGSVSLVAFILHIVSDHS